MENLTTSGRQRRIILIRLFLDFFRLFNRDAGRREQMLVMLAIHLGHYEGKPLDITAISALTSLPRTSVTRYVNQLRKEHRIKLVRVANRILPVVPAGRGQDQSFFDAADTALSRAIAELTKLDT